MPISFDWSATISNLPAQTIPAEWLATKGKGVKVALVDTGANLGLASLRHLGQIPGRKFFTAAPGFSVAKLTGQDMVGEAFGVAGPGHGTLFASLIAGKSPNPAPADKDLVTGIANEADFYIIKSTDESGEDTTFKHMLDALELAAKLGIDILITGHCRSNSLMGSDNVTQADIDRVFALPDVQKMFIFAPLKNRKGASFWPDITQINFPSNRPEVFNVAILPAVFMEVADHINAQNIPFLVSGFKGEVLSRTGVALSIGDEGSSDIEFFNSAAVYLMGGIATLALSVYKQQHGGALPSRDEFANILGNCCRPLDDAFGSFDKPSIFKKF